MTTTTNHTFHTTPRGIAKANEEKESHGELLAALEGLVAEAQIGLDQSATHDGIRNVNALMTARAAIAKARGLDA